MDGSGNGQRRTTAVPAVCDHGPCTTGILRDVDHRCGGTGFDGCGAHCCPEHLTRIQGVRGLQCPACTAHHRGEQEPVAGTPTLRAVPTVPATDTERDPAVGVA